VNIKESFTGRICTILTNPVSFPFKDAVQHSQFFTGKVELVDNQGIWLRHLHTNTIAFYSFPIIGIVEEQVIPQNDPRVEKIKAEMKKKEPKPPQPHSQFIPIESLTKMMKKS
jgi:hypothetical protein